MNDKHYYGKRCAEGHDGLRWRANGRCVECQREERRGRAEKDKQTNRNWYLKDTDRIKAVRQAWKANNRDLNRRLNEQWRKNNPDKVRLTASKRRATVRKAVPLWFEAEKVGQLYLRCEELNAALGLSGNSRLEVDHIIPLVSDTVCGLHCWANLQLLNRSDNSKKNNNYESDW